MPFNLSPNWDQAISWDQMWHIFSLFEYWFCFQGEHDFFWTGKGFQTRPLLTSQLWETWVWFLVWQDPMEEGMATHSSILAWRIPGTEESGGLQSMGLQRVGHDWVTKHTHNITKYPKIMTLLVRNSRYLDLSNYILLLEKEMATHSSILAWKIPWTEEPGGL